MIKKIVFVFVFYPFLLIINSCGEYYINQNLITEEEIIEISVPDEDIQIIISEELLPQELLPEESINDPHQTGIPCDETLGKKENETKILPPIEIPIDLPENYDLSENMPPVRSQGGQGSCVAWATTYYLKSYQEKIEHNYEYDSYEDVMSPAFTYNQIKINDHCNSGSNIVPALELLKEQGALSWKDFPYTDITCSDIPSDTIIKAAAQNKIQDYYTIQKIDSIKTVSHNLINIIKTLIYKKQPIIIAMDNFRNLHFSFKNNFYKTDYYTEDKRSCGHALLIVGYNDEINAFKIINSWGTDWGNEGYAWVNYTFFLPPENIDYQEGLTGTYVAFDIENDIINEFHKN